MIAIYHDDPETTPQDQLRSDAALVVPEGVTLPEGLAEQHIAGGRYARTLYVGPYDGSAMSGPGFLASGSPRAAIASAMG